VSSEQQLLPTTKLSKYLRNLERSNKNTAINHRRKLNPFVDFVQDAYNLTLDELIAATQSKIDVYELLSDYASYLQENRDVSPTSLKQMISVVRTFLETYDVEISPRKFKLKVILPRVIRTKKEAMEKSDVQAILNACSTIKLKTYVMLLAANGLRASEALSIRIADINFSSDPVTIFLRGQFTKTKEDRIIMVTQELAQQLESWIEYKHRPREITKYGNNNKTYVKKVVPQINKNLLLFSTKYNSDPTIEGLYNDMAVMFENTLQRMGGRFAEFEPSGKRRIFTLHSFRRFTKSLISDLGLEAFSEDYIGHRGSTYYRASMKEKVKIFRKIEPYITFLDLKSLEQKGADLQTRLEVMEKDNLSLRAQVTSDRDKYDGLLERISQLEKKYNVI
jgi:integrase